MLLHFPVPRVRCFDCGQVRPVKLGFADPKKHYTRAFERYISWDTVEDVQARVVVHFEKSSRRIGVQSCESI